MFDSLKKKLFSWIKPVEKETKKKSKKTEKPKKSSKKVTKKEPKKSKKTEKTQTKKLLESKIKKNAQDILEATLETEQLGEESEEIEAESQEKPNIKPEELNLAEKEIEITEEESSKKEPESKPNFFTKLINKISTSKLTQEQFDEIFMELELTLLENNVSLEAVDKIKESLSKKLVNMDIKKSEIENKIINSLKESILSLLIEPPNLIENIKKSSKPYIILFFGINGTGKTTSIAKIADLLQKNKISSVLAAADTFRAASIEQLQIHADTLKVPCISQKYGSDPASVAFDAIQYAKKNAIDVVLIDTAGRMYTKQNLLKEMEKIIRISQPNLKIFVGESITGNDATEQAKTFNEEIGLDGIILSKADIDDKAGAILSVSQATNKPIYFLGIGQKYKDLLPFTKKEVLKHLGLE